MSELSKWATTLLQRVTLLLSLSLKCVLRSKLCFLFGSDGVTPVYARSGIAYLK